MGSFEDCCTAKATLPASSWQSRGRRDLAPGHITCTWAGSTHTLTEEAAMSRNRDPEPTEDRPIERDEDDSLTPDPSGEAVEEGQRVRGQQAPGATSPPIPGIDPAEARGLVGRKRRIEEEGEDELDESEPGR